MFQLLQRTLIRNTSWIFLGQILSLLTQVASFIVLARLLGSQEFGIYIGAVSLVAIVSQYGTFGSGFVFLQYVSADRSKALQFWSDIVLALLLFGPAFVLLSVVLGYQFLHNGQPWLVLIVALGDCFFKSLSNSIARIYQAFERMHLTAAFTLAGNLVRLAIAIYLFLTLARATATQWAIGALIASGIVAIGSVIVVLYEIGIPRLSFRHLRPHLGEGFIFAMSDSTQSVYNDIDKIIMAHLNMDRANGAYSLAYRVINIASLPFVSLYAAAAPRFFREGEKGIVHTLPLIRKLLPPATAVGVLISLALYFSAPLVPLLVGKDFNTTVSALRGLCIIPLLRSLQWCAGDALAGAGLQRVRFMLQLGAAGFNFGINLYLIPTYSWLGAVWSSIATDGLLALAAWCALLWLVKKHPTTQSA